MKKTMLIAAVALIILMLIFNFWLTRQKQELSSPTQNVITNYKSEESFLPPLPPEQGDIVMRQDAGILRESKKLDLPPLDIDSQDEEVKKQEEEALGIRLNEEQAQELNKKGIMLY